MSKNKKTSGFTLMELLIVMAIIAILSGISIFSLQGARRSSRDAKRKGDLEAIRSALEIYKTDCDQYPINFGNVASILSGPFSGGGCNSNKYMETIPNDPNASSYYRYWSNGSRYELCAALEDATGSVTCGGSNVCGATCNYKVTSL